MPTEFDPAWEYYEPDPEIDWCVHGKAGRPFDRLYDGRVKRTGDAHGLQQTPRPDSYRSCLGRERAIAGSSGLRLRKCPACEMVFKPVWRHESVYCSTKCLGVSRRASRRCRHCGGNFWTPKNNKRKCCSQACGEARRLLAAMPRVDRRRECLGCRREYLRKRPEQKFCDEQCRANYYGPIKKAATQARAATKTCEWCDGGFLAVRPIDIRTKRFCAKSCARKFQHAQRRASR